MYLLITYTHYNHITNFKPGDLEKTSFRSIKPGIQKKGASTSRRSTRNVLKDITNISHLRKKNEKLPSPKSNASAHNIYEDDAVVGNDLFGGLMYCNCLHFSFTL